MKNLYSASYVVSYLSKKYGVNSVWLWDLLEEEFNIIKGMSGMVALEERKALEKIILES